MKMAKKTLAALLVLCMAVTFLAGCGTAQNSTSDSSSAAAPVSTQSGPAPSSTPDSTQTSVEPLEIQMMLPVYNTVDMNDNFWTMYQEKTNTKLDIEWVPSADLNSKTDLKLASGDLPEVLVNDLGQSRPTMLNAVKRGMFANLSTYLGDFSEYPNLRDNMRPVLWNYAKVDDNIYAVPRSRPQVNRSIKIRKDWLDKLNIPVPTTTDEYRAALKKIVTGDPDGNGKIDTMGLTGYQFMNFFDTTIAEAFGIYTPSYDADGGLISEYLTDDFADFIQYFRDLYSDGSLPKQFFSMTGDQNTQIWLAGRSASMVNNYWHDYPDMQAIKKIQPDVNILSLPPMKGPKGYTAELDRGIAFYFFISSKVPADKVKQILGYFNNTSTPEFLDIAYYGFEGVHYNVVDGAKVMTELGLKEVGMSEQGPNALMKNNWAKVMFPGAPKEFNDNLQKQAEANLAKGVGQVDFNSVLNSETWASLWPKYQKEWQSNEVKAIVGQISMKEYRDYVTNLRNQPEFKKAFQEFAVSYKKIFPNGNGAE